MRRQAGAVLLMTGFAVLWAAFAAQLICSAMQPFLGR